MREGCEGSGRHVEKLGGICNNHIFSRLQYPSESFHLMLPDGYDWSSLYPINPSKGLSN